MNFINRVPALNDFNIPSAFRPYYEIFFQECLQALKKIYSYMSERKPAGCKCAADIYIHEFAEYLRGRIVNLHKCNKGMPFHDWAYDYEMLPLNGLVFYNTFWKGCIMVPQRAFMDKFTAAANRIDPEYGRLKLAFELIGIDFDVNDNEELYAEIIRQIQSARDVYKETVITHLLKVVFQEKTAGSQPGLSEASSLPDTETESGPDLKQQKSILDRLNKELSQYIKIAGGRTSIPLHAFSTPPSSMHLFPVRIKVDLHIYEAPRLQIPLNPYHFL